MVQNILIYSPQPLASRQLLHLLRAEGLCLDTTCLCDNQQLEAFLQEHPVQLLVADVRDKTAITALSRCLSSGFSAEQTICIGTLPPEATPLNNCSWLQPPVASQQLRDTIRRLYPVADPKQPKPVSNGSCQPAWLYQRQYVFDASIIRISMTGALCELAYPGTCHWDRPWALLPCSWQQQDSHIAPIVAQPVGWHIMAQQPDQSPARIQLALDFLDIPLATRQKLQDELATTSLTFPAAE